ncbi:hypothetical protein M378DRAFT_181472 [Amanita muscaria Koide BX008]|uniref:Uncharacterized protein n=1 Tax=Amanita muscaria (strain Koide BX008) TaxID=946122 RepID=A0A0C2WNZ2_AMAMK|nr:hypothetical protein M378DRAFT_181472 [Amanita muscaria Koide BX008]
MAPKKRSAKVVKSTTLAISDDSGEEHTNVLATPQKLTPRQAKNKRKVIEIESSSDENSLAEAVAPSKKPRPVARSKNKGKEADMELSSDEKLLADTIPSLKEPNPIASGECEQGAGLETAPGRNLNRIRKLSAKALYMSGNSNDAVEAPVATAKKPMFVPNVDSGLFPGATQSARTNNDTILKAAKGAHRHPYISHGKVSESPASDSSDIEASNPLSLSELPPATPPKYSYRAIDKAKNRSLFGPDSDSELAGNSGGDSSDEQHSKHSLDMRNLDKSKHAIKDLRNNTSTPVMLDSLPPVPNSGLARNKDIINNPLMVDPELIDPMLADDYPTLPMLRNSQLVPYGRHAGSDQYMIGYTQLYNSLRNDRDQGLLRAAVRFTSSLPFINPSRADPNIVLIENGRICLPDSTTRNKPAVCLTTGLLVESSLQTPAVCTTNAGTDYKVKQVLLNPFSGEYERATAFFGTAYGVDNFTCQMEDSCIFFTTRREGAGADSNISHFSGIINYHFVYDFVAPGSPVRSRKVASGLQISSPVKRTNRYTSTKLTFPASLGFKDTVPIYDARLCPEFAFRPDDLQNIAKLPVYDDRNSDIVGNRFVVTVGYTVSSWATPNSTKSVGMNIQFVIVLAKTHAKA